MADDGDPVVGGNIVPISRALSRSRRKRVVRARSEALGKRGTKRQLLVFRADADLDLLLLGDFFSPTTRGDCARVPRPCPHVSCRHHLYLDVSPGTGTIKLNFPDLSPEELRPDASCSLDVADAGEHALEEVGDLMNVTRERIRQAETKALSEIERAGGAKMRAAAPGEYGGGAPRVRIHASGPRRTAVVPQETPEETPEPIEDERNTLLLRGLSRAEQHDAERFARIAATLVLAGWRPLDAWTRANALIREVEPGDPLPVLFADVAAETSRRPAFVTPPERLTEPPKDVERLVPKETAARVDLDEEELPPVSQDDGPAPELDELRERLARDRNFHPETRADRRDKALVIHRDTKPENRTPEETPMPVPMSNETIELREKILAALKLNGPMAPRDLVASLDVEFGRARHAMKTLVSEGETEVVGMARASRWQMRGEKRQEAATAAKPVPKSAKKTKPNGAAKANGHANGHAAPAGAVQGALAALAAAFQAEHEASAARLKKKLDAIAVLAEQE